MRPLIEIQNYGDPSDILQTFPNHNLQILCCRYWWLSRWEFGELSFPYWRIYYNNKEGASVNYQGQALKLLPDKIYLIAPNTSYSSQLYNNRIPKAGYVFEGGRILESSNKNQQKNTNSINHFFIHFNIGIQYDNVSPGIFSFDLTEHLKEKLDIITNQLKTNAAQFSFHSFLALQSLIIDLLSEISDDYWNLLAKDYRILNVLSHIESNPEGDMSNENLAKISKLTTNAFNRLFTNEIGISPQKFVRRKRIDKACVLLHHSEYSIDDIALRTGFANRYHFTRIFKEITGIAPGKYRKEFSIK